VDLPVDAVVGIAHPLDLGDGVSGWAGVFADYEVLQPFAQLGRETYGLTDEERDSRHLARFEERSAPTTKLLGLERRGWVRGMPQDAGIQGWFERTVPGNQAVVIDIEPGIVVGEVTYFTDQKVNRVWVNDAPRGGWYANDRGLSFAALDPVTASEILRDLTEMIG
jgi:hypothetical protein